MDVLMKKNLRYPTVLVSRMSVCQKKIQIAVSIFYLYLVAFAFRNKFCHDESF